MNDYVPHNDAEFNSWQANLVGIVEAQLIPWGILAADLTTLKTAQAAWTDAYAQAEIKTNRSTSEVQAKKDARTMYEAELRTFYKQWLANNIRVTNKDRERMGLTVKTDSRTPVSTPTTSPAGKVDFATRLQHKVFYSDSATPGRKGKPDGVHGCEVWSKVDGGAPVDASELIYLGTATRSPYTVTFEGKQIGKTAWYMFRWVNTREEHGPWSNVISATIAG